MALAVGRRVGAARPTLRFPVLRAGLSTLPSVPEPPMPSAKDAQVDAPALSRTGAVSSFRDPFMSRKLQGKHGVFRGRDVVPMWIADMDFRCPQPVIDATIACAQRGIFGYTNPPDDLVTSTLARLSHVYGCAAPESEWLHWMSGLVPGLSHAIRVAKKRHGHGADALRVAVLTPAYPPFLALPAYHGAELDAIPLAAGTESTGGLHHTLDWPLLEARLAHSATKLLLLCNPHNPTGRCWSASDLRRLASLCVENDVLLCSDEVWGELPLDAMSTPFTSALALLGSDTHGSGGGVAGLRERLLVLTSPSKCFNMATLDVAFAVVPDAELRNEFIAEGRDMAEVTPFGYFAAEAVRSQSPQSPPRPAPPRAPPLRFACFAFVACSPHLVVLTCDHRPGPHLLAAPLRPMAIPRARPGASASSPTSAPTAIMPSHASLPSLAC